MPPLQCEESALTTAVVEEVSPLVDPATSSSALRRGPRRQPVLGAVGLVLVALLLGAAVAFWGSSPLAARGSRRPYPRPISSAQDNLLQLEEESDTVVTTAYPVAEKTKELIAQEVSLDNKVKGMKTKAQRDMAAAERVEHNAQKKKEAALKVAEEANHSIIEANEDAAKSKAMQEKANATIDHANAIEAEMNRVTANARVNIAQADSQLQKAADNKAHGKQMVVEAKARLEDAADKEQQAFDIIAANRECVSLPGVRLRGGEGASDFDPIAAEKRTDTAELCQTWCHEHQDCAQAVFSSGNKGCYLSKHTNTEVWEFSDGYNASYCGNDKDELMKKLNKAFDQKPYVPEPVDCSWSGDDCTKTKCCNDQQCSWDFTDCKGFTCYKNQPYSGSCMNACYGPNCQVIGGPRQPRLLPKAKEGKTLQGDSLFCFMVVAWAAPAAEAYWDPENALVDQQKKLKAGIFECDAHQIFSGHVTAKTDWSTYINADLFIDIWKQVQKDGQYAMHDWTVKVDADAVFFPTILKQHMSGWRVPQGGRAYVRNTGCKFGFLGALEILTRQALDFYFQKGWVCQSKPHDKQGEDFYMKSCLEAVGVDYIEDKNLLHTKECKDGPGSDGSCKNKWAVAFHFHRSVEGWKTCYWEAKNLQK